MTLGVDVPAGGAILAALGSRSVTLNHGWSGLTEDFENDRDNTTFSAAHAEFAAGQTPQAVSVAMSDSQQHSGVAVAFAS